MKQCVCSFLCKYNIVTLLIYCVINAPKEKPTKRNGLLLITKSFRNLLTQNNFLENVIELKNFTILLKEVNITVLKIPIYRFPNK